VRIGSTEKKILSMARQFDTVKNMEMLPSSAFKSLVRKDCLVRVEYGEFEITEKGKKALSKREEEEEKSQDQSGLGEFS